MMTGRLRSWMVPLLLLGTMAYAIAEEITLTTYYPSPRGVYDQLRTAGNVQIGSIDPPADANTAPRLHIQQLDNLSTAPLLQVESARAGATPVVIDKDGNVGIGVTDPTSGAKLEVAGELKLGTSASMAGALRWNGSGFQGHDGSDWINFAFPPGIQTARITGPTSNPSCPAGYGVIVKKWVSRRCDSTDPSCPGGCDTPNAWGATADKPTCTYNTYTEDPLGFETGCLKPNTCEPTSWSEVICVGGS